MPWDPQVTDRSGEFLGAGIARAGQAGAAAIDQVQKNHQMNDFLTQQARDMAGINGPDGQPLMSQETLDKFATGNLAQKKASIADALFQMNQTFGNADYRRKDQELRMRQRALDQTNQYQTDHNKIAGGHLALQAAEFNAGQAPWNPQAVQLRDPNTGAPLYDANGNPKMLQTTSRNSAVPLNMGAGKDEIGRAPIVSPDGKFFHNGREWKPYTQDAAERDTAKPSGPSWWANLLSNLGGYKAPAQPTEPPPASVQTPAPGAGAPAAASPVPSAPAKSKALDATALAGFMAANGNDPSKAAAAARNAGYTW